MLRRLALYTLMLVVPPVAASAQVLTWQELPSAPQTSRHNDVFFVSTATGWIVNGAGEIFKTEDGGGSWDPQFSKSDAHFRSVGFVNPLRGFAGNVGFGEFGATDRSALYETSDGGNSWHPMAVWQGRSPTGLCGMQVVNDSVVVAVGRVRGPASFARTTDGGATWRSRDMGAHAAGLIDVYFTHPDTGFVVGLTNVDHELSSGIVLYTDDGGESWETRHRTTRTGEWCWKLSFPSRRVGYASLQRNSETPIYFLKTTDGGETWDEKLFADAYYFVQGIGFIDELHGWIGGNSTSPVFETRDGGETWFAESLRPRLNRFRFLGDSLGYAAGRSVHKLANWSAVGVDEIPVVTALPTTVNYPNPFSGGTSVHFTLDRATRVVIDVYDVLGRRLTRLVDAHHVPGSHSVEWDGRTDSGARVPAGSYLYAVATDAGTVVRAMHIVR